MNILIATDTYYPNVNGASYFTQRLAFYLQQRDHTVLVIAPSRTFAHERYRHDGVDILGIRSIPVLVYKEFRVCPAGLFKPTLRRAFQEFSPDVVHIQSHFFLDKAVLAVAREFGIPTVGTNHFMPENLLHYLHLPGMCEAFLKRVAWGQFRAVFQHVKLVTTPTTTAATLLQDSGLKQPVYPLSCGIDRKRFFLGWVL